MNFVRHRGHCPFAIRQKQVFFSSHYFITSQKLAHIFFTAGLLGLAAKARRAPLMRLTLFRQPIFLLVVHTSLVSLSIWPRVRL